MGAMSPFCQAAEINVREETSQDLICEPAGMVSDDEEGDVESTTLTRNTKPHLTTTMIGRRILQLTHRSRYKT